MRTSAEISAELDLFVTNKLIPPMTEENRVARIQAAINLEARAFLRQTDWYVTRFSETGVAIPTDIAAARADARSKVV